MSQGGQVLVKSEHEMTGEANWQRSAHTYIITHSIYMRTHSIYMKTRAINERA